MSAEFYKESSPWSSSFKSRTQSAVDRILQGGADGKVSGEAGADGKVSGKAGADGEVRGKAGADGKVSGKVDFVARGGIIFTIVSALLWLNSICFVTCLIHYIIDFSRNKYLAR